MKATSAASRGFCVSGRQRHRVGNRRDARVARDLAHPQVPALRDHHDARGAVEEEAHDGARHRAALLLVEGGEAAAVEVEDDGPARQQRQGHEAALAPEARARGGVHVQDRARVPAQQREEDDDAVDRLEELLERIAVAVRGDVLDGPALEQARAAVAVHHRGHAAAGGEGRADHDDAGRCARHVRPPSPRRNSGGCPGAAPACGPCRAACARWLRPAPPRPRSRPGSCARPPRRWLRAAPP